jgi:hypothetical protein
MDITEVKQNPQNYTFNFSDRAVAKLSGTTYNGNTLQKVLDTIRHLGLVPESMWSFPDNITWDEYYKDIPQNIIDFGKNFTDMFDVFYEWTNISDCQPNFEAVKAHLKQAPLQRVSSYSGGVCNFQHATLLYDWDDNYQYVFDSYNGGKTRFPTNYPMPALMKIVVSPKVQTEWLMIPPITKDLWFGNRNEEVKYLQRKLIKLGYLSKGLDTGYYGPLTKLAVKEFQWVNKVASIPVLIWNGGKFVGVATRSKLNML